MREGADAIGIGHLPLNTMLMNQALSLAIASSKHLMLANVPIEDGCSHCSMYTSSSSPLTLERSLPEQAGNASLAVHQPFHMDNTQVCPEPVATTQVHPPANFAALKLFFTLTQRLWLLPHHRHQDTAVINEASLPGPNFHADLATHVPGTSHVYAALSHFRQSLQPSWATSTFTIDKAMLLNGSCLLEDKPLDRETVPVAASLIEAFTLGEAWRHLCTVLHSCSG